MPAQPLWDEMTGFVAEEGAVDATGFEYTHKPWQPSPASPGVSSGIPRPRSSTQAQPGAFSSCLCWAGGMLVST